MMRAWILHSIDDIRYEEVNVPEPKDGEVLVEVKAVGICGSDIPRIYQNGAHKMPLIPGHEFAGKVVKVGTGVTDRWLEKKVGIFPLVPCRKCVACAKEAYEMCRNYNYLGSRCDGGFAEYVSVPVSNLIELPEKVTYEEAAMLEPMAVAVHAMRRVCIKETDNVVVCGLGTIGMLLVMFLLEQGAKKVLVIGNKEFQKKQVLALGISEEHYCDSRQMNVSEWIMEHTAGIGADVFFECVGKNETYMQAIDLTSIGGSVCLVGNPHSDMRLSQQIYWKILRNQLQVTGTWNSSFTGKVDDDWHYVLKLLEAGKIHPGGLISHHYPLDELETGFHIMKDKSEDYIKIMAYTE